ncbi:hypothetical protein TPY_0559 [Sulfobacillus acidophilus TPY]|nr:hypothetical protein TPY_0559 [Sulfobacillus acidophilus TPY]
MRFLGARLTIDQEISRQFSSISPISDRWWRQPWFMAWLIHDGFMALATVLPFHVHHNPLLPNLSVTLQDRGWFHFDAAYYFFIGFHGYGQPKMAAFYPGLPLLIALFKNPWLILLVTQLAFGQSLRLLDRLAQALALFGQQRLFILLAFALNPMAVFDTTAYSEIWTFLTALASLDAARQRHFAQASLWAFLATLTHGTGVLVGIMPLTYAVRSIYRRDWPRLRLALLWGAGTFMGFSSYALYLAVHFRQPWLIFTVERQFWDAHWTWPWAQWLTLLQHRPAFSLWYGLIALGFVIFGVRAVTSVWRPSSPWWAVPASVYGVSGLLVSCSFDVMFAPFHSTARLLSDYFPFYLFAGNFSRLGRLITLTLWSFWAFLSAVFFIHGVWVQ